MLKLSEKTTTHNYTGDTIYWAVCEHKCGFEIGNTDKEELMEYDVGRKCTGCKK